MSYRATFARRTRGGALLLALWSGAAFAAAPKPWPGVALPPGISVFGVDSATVVNGTPMRMQGFTAPQSPAQLAAWYRNSLGQPLVENQLGPKLVLGQARGEYFISVQLEAIGSGTRAVVAVTHLKAGFEQQGANAAADARLSSRMPAGTRVVSRLASSDGGRNASHVVLSNGHSEELNRERLIGMLREDGLKLERDARPDPERATGSTLMFKGRGREAMAVITRGRDNLTTIILNQSTLTELRK